ncbi:metalloregulator ArsR/SmtB family transcription factor [Acetobacterium paludosum]|uniref:Metalloregulator ArsR/SmtB family transcription factor n=1 Tax=Acetobacterium paludosum TaxID=52693 RepID=A0A923HTH7_9FIRM|nr:metalloregulator ArsR/SmtB family transcription factor [Acetobacterium paludosum]MBC3886990.1 metalloregulator ArsR/SmtB family transcription factor [Acetobacterium paludosum]
MDKDFDKYNEIAEILKVLAHPVRLCIVKGLIENGECNVTHMQSCLDTPQSTTSQHLQKLRAAGIVEGKRNGLEINYRVCNDKVIDIIKTIFKDN